VSVQDDDTKEPNKLGYFGAHNLQMIVLDCSGVVDFVIFLECPIRLHRDIYFYVLGCVCQVARSARVPSIHAEQTDVEGRLQGTAVNVPTPQAQVCPM